MGFFRYNDPLQQFIGAVIASIIFVTILKWAFSSNPKMIVLPIAAGKKDQYGLFKANRCCADEIRCGACTGIALGF